MIVEVKRWLEVLRKGMHTEEDSYRSASKLSGSKRICVKTMSAWNQMKLRR